LTINKTTEYTLRIGPAERYRHLHESVNGRIRHFCVQLEVRENGVWLPVVRYDTAHGFAHRDILDRSGKNIEKTPLFGMDYNDALTFAESDLKANWEFYKHLFEKGGKS